MKIGVGFLLLLGVSGLPIFLNLSFEIADDQSDCGSELYSQARIPFFLLIFFCCIVFF